MPIANAGGRCSGCQISGRWQSKEGRRDFVKLVFIGTPYRIASETKRLLEVSRR